MKKVICTVLAIIVLLSSLSFVSAFDNSERFSYNTDKIQKLSSNEITSWLNKADIKIGLTDSVSQIQYIDNSGHMAGAILVRSAHKASQSTIDIISMDLIVPYTFNEETNTMMNSFAYNQGTATYPDIFISARWYYYYTYDYGITYYRPYQISMSYSLTNSNFEIFSLTGTCQIRGQICDTNFNVLAYGYGMEMNFYQAHPVQNVFYASPTSQALSSNYWIYFNSILSGDGAGYNVIYSGWKNGVWFQHNDGLYFPISEN